MQPAGRAVFNGSMDEDLRPGLAADLDATFEALVRAHQDRLFSLALRFLGDAADAEEIVQDGFVRVYRALRTYDEQRIRDLDLRPWLSSIVLNLCRTRYRRRTRTRMAVVAGGLEDRQLPAPATDTPTSGPPAARRRSTGPSSSAACPSSIAPPSCFGTSTACPTRR